MRNIKHQLRLTALLSTLELLLALPIIAGTGLFYEEAPIHYSDTEARDPLALLVEQIEKGDLVMDTSSDRDFLRDLLTKLEIPIATQMLVYSKTSFQNTRILPARPRALYFSEEYYIGWVRGGDIEVISMDPKLGPVFYVLSIPQAPEEKPLLTRDPECLNCHGGTRTGGVPGMLVRSVRPDVAGFPILSAGTSQTDHASPLAKRWGGWYVTGDHAGARHMGNRLYRQDDRATGAQIVTDHGVLKTLDDVIDTSAYLTNKSDIVALMVMEHQITVHNAITQANVNTRRWMHYDKALSAELDEPTSGNAARFIDHQSDKLLEAMLFKDEFPLEGWGVEGDDAFQEAFLADAPRSQDGRSLKDFDLLSRLFRHRLSYMIYSKSFDQLPSPFLDRFYDKLHDTLKGSDGTETYRYLKEKERSRILTILMETKPAFAARANHR